MAANSPRYDTITQAVKGWLSLPNSAKGSTGHDICRYTYSHKADYIDQPDNDHDCMRRTIKEMFCLQGLGQLDLVIAFLDGSLIDVLWYSPLDTPNPSTNIIVNPEVVYKSDKKVDWNKTLAALFQIIGENVFLSGDDLVQIFSDLYILDRGGIPKSSVVFGKSLSLLQQQGLIYQCADKSWSLNSPDHKTVSPPPSNQYFDVSIELPQIYHNILEVSITHQHLPISVNLSKLPGSHLVLTTNHELAKKFTGYPPFFNFTGTIELEDEKESHTIQVKYPIDLYIIYIPD